MPLTFDLFRISFLKYFIVLLNHPSVTNIYSTSGTSLSSEKELTVCIFSIVPVLQYLIKYPINLNCENLNGPFGLELLC